MRTKEEKQKEREKNKKIWQENADKWTDEADKFVQKINKRKIGYYICCGVIPALVMVGCYFLYALLDGWLPVAVTAVALFLILLIYGRAVAKRGTKKLGIFSLRRMRKEVKQKYCLAEKILRGVGIALFVCGLLAFLLLNVWPSGRELIGNDPAIFAAVAAGVALGCLLGLCRPGFRKKAYCRRCGCCNSYYLTNTTYNEVGRTKGLFKKTGSETYSAGDIYVNGSRVGSLERSHATGYYYDKVKTEKTETYNCRNCGYRKIVTSTWTHEDKW